MSKLVAESTSTYHYNRIIRNNIQKQQDGTNQNKKKELQIWTHKVSTWRQRTYLFVYPKSFTNGTSIALASWRAHVTNLV
jgi:hypothetical protein